MRNRTYIDIYVNTLRKYLSKHLKNGVNLFCNVYPVRENGAVIELFFGNGFRNKDKVMPQETNISAVLKKIPQKMIGGDINRVSFGGTSFYLENNRILIIKGDDNLEDWSSNSAKNDVLKILAPFERKDII